MCDRNGVSSITPITLTNITNEHLLNLDILCQELETNLYRGLKVSHVKRILKENGKNKITRPKNTFMIDGGLLERNTSKKEKFSKSEWRRVFGQQLPNEVTVIRDGVRKEVFAKYIVVGDLIELEANDVVPADIRLIWSKNLVLDNRLITGNGCELRTHLLNKAKEDPLLSPNMIFACTKVISGECIGIALKTGEDTVFGTLKYFATKVKIEKSRYATRSGSVQSSTYSESGSTSSIGDSDSRRDSGSSTFFSNKFIENSEHIENRRPPENYRKQSRSISDCYANVPIDFNISKSITKSESTDSVFF